MRRKELKQTRAGQENAEQNQTNAEQNQTGKTANKSRLVGHLAALFTMTLWATTFISTKVLLTDFSPVEILFFRFVMGFAALLIMCPRRLKGIAPKQELIFAAAGLCGICLYYLLENIALTYTLASNVSVILSIAPFFIAILAFLFLKTDQKPTIAFFAGFVVAMAGIVLISLNGSALKLNPLGDILSVVAAFVWGCYSTLTRKIGEWGYPVMLTVRRTFFYGILFMLPALFFLDFNLDLTRFSNMTYLLNIIYLGLGASAICFVTWNIGVNTLGTITASTYIYISPAITVFASVLILHEPITLFSLIGTALTIVGLFLSQYKGKKKDDSKPQISKTDPQSGSPDPK